MINIEKLSKSTNSINVPPSDRIFEELGRNTYDYKDLLSELIDNALAARVKNKLLKITIDIYVDENNEPVEFSIIDNASGIPSDKLGLAISPAGIQSQDSLNEHGMGMKQAVGALGRLKYLATKTKNDKKARLIKEFQFGNIDTFLVDFPNQSGTEINITKVNAIVSTNPGRYTRKSFHIWVLGIGAF